MQPSRTVGPKAARKLLEDGEFDADERLCAVGSPSIYAYLAIIVFLTEPTRLVVRRDKGVGGFLKWHIADLVGILPVAWGRDSGGEVATCNIVAACQRQRLVFNYHREIRAGEATKTVIDFRSNRPPVLEAIHQTLARRIVEAPIRLMYPTSYSQASVSESLVRQCLVLPYDERAWLARVVWQGGGMDGCPLSAARLINEIRKLSVAHREELRTMLW